MGDQALHPFVVTFLLELPWDLKLWEGATVFADEQREDVEIGVFTHPPDYPNELEIDAQFVFRRSRSGFAYQRTLALDVFADFWEGHELFDSEPARQELTQEAHRTVVAASRATLKYENNVLSEDVLVDLFERTLHQLSEFLAMFGFVRQDPHVGAIRRTELPSHIPVMLDFAVNGGPRQLELSYLQLHSFESESVPTADDVDYAIDYTYRDRLFPWPFRQVVLLMHRARRDLLGGDNDQGVIALTTGVELLTETVVAASLRIGGKDDRIQGVLDAGLTNLLRDHLAPLLTRLGQNAYVVDRWITDCYALRKRVAHEGFRPHPTDALTALATTTRLASTLGTGLRANPAFAELGDLLPFGT